MKNKVILGLLFGVLETLQGTQTYQQKMPVYLQMFYTYQHQQLQTRLLLMRKYQEWVEQMAQSDQRMAEGDQRMAEKFQQSAKIIDQQSAEIDQRMAERFQQSAKKNEKNAQENQQTAQIFKKAHANIQKELEELAHQKKQLAASLIMKQYNIVITPRPTVGTAVPSVGRQTTRKLPGCIAFVVDTYKKFV